MITQKHREYSKSESNGCFIVSKSEEEMYNELVQYAKANQDKDIYYYTHPVRPSKETLRPEYMMEVEIESKDDYPKTLHTRFKYYKCHNYIKRGL